MVQTHNYVVKVLSSFRWLEERGAGPERPRMQSDTRIQDEKGTDVIDKELRTFEEFWPHYLGEHLHAANRALHFIGTSLVYGMVALALVQSPRWLLLTPLIGYGFAWAGHYFVERNRPATFTYPLWSLRGDFRMHARMLTGALRIDLDRLRPKAPLRGDPV